MKACHNKGERYIGVPTRVFETRFRDNLSTRSASNALLTPKSAILTSFAAVSKIFSGLMSRW
jgi:hypothetical protein